MDFWYYKKRIKKGDRMSKVVDSVFGGNEGDNQKKENKRSRAYTVNQGKRAREDLMILNPVADANRNMGFEKALDIFGQAYPQQMSAFQQGNAGAQQALINGMSQYQDAIMGRPLDMSQSRVRRINTDPSYMYQKLPEFIKTPDAGLRVDEYDNFVSIEDRINPPIVEEEVIL